VTRHCHSRGGGGMVQRHSVTLVVNHCRQVGRSLLLLAHYTSVFVAFVARAAEWVAGATRWTTLFTERAASAFDALHRYLTWGNGRGVVRASYPVETPRLTARSA